jgi:hypothetical protein
VLKSVRFISSFNDMAMMRQPIQQLSLFGIKAPLISAVMAPL